MQSQRPARPAASVPSASTSPLFLRANSWLRAGPLASSLLPVSMSREGVRMKAAVMVPGPQGGVWDVREMQRPVVGPGLVLVRVHASSINRAEFRRLHGLRDGEARTGGGDAAGEVVDIGAGVAGIKEGDRIMARCAGGFAEFALVDAREVMPAPKAL